MTFQKNPIYIRDPSETTGWRFLCDSEAGGSRAMLSPKLHESMMEIMDFYYFYGQFV